MGVLSCGFDSGTQGTAVAYNCIKLPLASAAEKKVLLTSQHAHSAASTKKIDVKLGASTNTE